MLKILEFLKSHKKIEKYIVLISFLFASCFLEQFVWAFCALAVWFAIDNTIEENIELLGFSYCFNILVQAAIFNHLYILFTCLLTGIVCIKHLILTIQKKAKQNWFLLATIVVFLGYMLLPPHIFDIFNWARYCCLFALVYCVFCNRKTIKFKQIAKFFVFGLLISLLFSAFLKYMPRAQAFQHDRLYSGILGHPNTLTTACVLGLGLVLTLFVKDEINKPFAFVSMIGIFAAGCLTQTRTFFVAVVVMFVAFAIICLVKYKKKALVLLLAIFVVALVPAIVFREQLTNMFGKFGQKPMNMTSEGSYQFEDIDDIIENKNLWPLVQSGQMYVDPGRQGIYKMYAKDLFSSAKNVLFGRGISAPNIGQMATHNTFLQLWWFHGLVGLILIGAMIASMINWKKIKPKKLLFSLAFVGAFLCGTAFDSIYVAQLQLFAIYFIALFGEDDKKSFGTKVKLNPELLNKKSDALVSMVVPIYNVEKYLVRCVESLIVQTHKNLEIILVDDGSPDMCPEICDRLAKIDKRIVVIHKPNGGLSDARNAGIDIAKGEFICFVDSDDFVHEKYVEVLLSNLISTNSDMAMCDFCKVHENKKYKPMLKNELIVFEGEEVVDYIQNDIRTCTIMVGTKIYKKSLFEDGLRFEKGKLFEDSFFCHHVFAKCKKIVCSYAQLFFYFHRLGSITSNKKFDERYLDKYKAFEDRYNFFVGTRWEQQSLSRLVSVIAHVYDEAVQKKADPKLLDNLRQTFNAYYKLLNKKQAKHLLFKMSPKLYCFVKKLRRWTVEVSFKLGLSKLH